MTPRLCLRDAWHAPQTVGEEFVGANDGKGNGIGGHALVTSSDVFVATRRKPSSSLPPNPSGGVVYGRALSVVCVSSRWWGGLQNTKWTWKCRAMYDHQCQLALTGEA